MLYAIMKDKPFTDDHQNSVLIFKKVNAYLLYL